VKMSSYESSTGSHDTSLSESASDSEGAELTKGDKSTPDSHLPRRGNASVKAVIEEKIDLDSGDEDAVESEKEVEEEYNALEDDCSCMAGLNGGPRPCYGWWTFKTTALYYFSRQVDRRAQDNFIFLLPLFIVATLESMVWITYFFLVFVCIPIWVAVSAVSICMCCKIKGFSSWVKGAVSLPANLVLFPLLILQCFRRRK